MATEREVKLSASPAFRMPSLDDLGDDVLVLPMDPARLRTLYFDTEDLRLARWGVSLRHRDGQGWTVKLPAEGGGDLLIRDELSFPGDEPENGAGASQGDEPGDDLIGPPEEVIDPIRAYVRTATLRPAVRLRTIRRMVRLIDFDDRRLGDVVDDEVSVLTGRRISARFRELEMEITDDTPAGLLDEVLRRLRAAGAGPPDPTSKYMRAVGPLATQPPEIVPHELGPDATVSDVLRRALAMSAAHLIRHDVVMRLDVDPEGVHQARVSTRRLRSDLRTFRAFLDPEWTGSLREELRWLGGVLGEARDADVLWARLRDRAGDVPATEAPGLAEVIEDLERRRKEAHAALMEALRGDRYVELLERLVEAARDPAVLPAADGPAEAIASGLLGGPWGRLRSAVRHAGRTPTDEELHAIRIRAKRVRYSADAVEPLLGKPARRFAVAAAALQTVLGEHNDAIVAESWLRDWAASRRSGDSVFAAGMLAGIERAAASEARGHWRKAWKALAAARRAM